MHTGGLMTPFYLCIGLAFSITTHFTYEIEKGAQEGVYPNVAYLSPCGRHFT
jgi:hypothetical protein